VSGQGLWSAFTQGLLIVGIPGTGKSLTAKATASVFKVPLLKLDAGRIFAGLVGQSESNLRSVIQTAEAIAPCVLWIDELRNGNTVVFVGAHQAEPPSAYLNGPFGWEEVFLSKEERFGSE